MQVSGGRSARALYGLVYVAGQLSDKVGGRADVGRSCGLAGDAALHSPNCCRVQDAASSSAAAQELPSAAAAMLLQLYGDAAPQPLQAAAQAALAHLTQ
jgi:hypothetical protein